MHQAYQLISGLGSVTLLSEILQHGVNLIEVKVKSVGDMSVPAYLKVASAVGAISESNWRRPRGSPVMNTQTIEVAKY